MRDNDHSRTSPRSRKARDLGHPAILASLAWVTLTNTAPFAQKVQSIRTFGENYHQFAQTNNCGDSLLGGASCTVSVTFSPTSAGGKATTLQINGSSANQGVPLNGVGFR